MATPNSSDFNQLLAQHSSPYVTLSPEQAARLHSHYDLLARWNKVLNLTTIRDLEETVIRHYCESLFLGAHLPPQPTAILDLGSGAGFPGVPVAVLRPDCQVTLSESHQRKAVFLREATRDWPNVRVEARRAEQLSPTGFDWVVSRAVRWQDVAPVALRGIALLLGESDAASALQSPDFDWESPLPLPWGRAQLLVIGHRR